MTQPAVPPPRNSSKSCSPSTDDPLRLDRDGGPVRAVSDGPSLSRWQVHGSWVVALALAACGGPSTPTDPPLQATAPAGLNQTSPATAGPGATVAAGVVVAPTASASAPSSATAPKRFAGAAFPPPDYPPIHERTREPDDGTWRPLPMPLDGPSVMAVSTSHPHPIKGFVFVKVVAFDRRYLDLRLVAGTQEPQSKVVAVERRPGLVPSQDQGRLLAVFNGGFKAKHGSYGMLLDGDLFVPPKDDACAVAQYLDETIRIRSWPVLSGDVQKLSAYRQTPPCLVEQGELNPRLKSAYKSRRWGSAVGGVQDIRRSAVGLDKTGRNLLYGFGDWVTPGELALAMKAAGAVDAAQLDINWSYTRFFLFDHPPGGPPHIRETIIPKLKFSKNRYIDKSSYRDFYYVGLRPGTAR